MPRANSEKSENGATVTFQGQAQLENKADDGLFPPGEQTIGLSEHQDKLSSNENLAAGEFTLL
jgi:hypothetical protein